MFKELKEKIWYLGINDRTTSMFEAIWPIPKGISYNSYFIEDEKTVLIESMGEAYYNQYITQLKYLLKGRQLDYLIINHIEPDHSGAIRDLRREYPDLIIVGNKKTLEMLNSFYNINMKTMIIDEDTVLNTGRYSFKFFITPMLHWPETMFTYEIKTKTLFSGDAFGSFGALNGGIIDCDTDISEYQAEMRRYYVTIISKYANQVQSAFNKIKNTEVEMICPTHGPVWKEYAPEIFSIYNRFSRNIAEKGVTIVYGSMYGHTAEMADTIAVKLSEAGIKEIRIYDSSHTDISYILSSIIHYNVVVIGSAVYNGSLMPNIEHLIDAIKERKIQHKDFASFSNYSWAPAAIKKFDYFAEEIGWQKLEPTIIQKSNETDDNRESEILRVCNYIIDRVNLNME